MDPGKISEVITLTTLAYKQSQRALLVIIWILVVVVVVAYIFQIWIGVASINMLQTAQPSDSFKQNNTLYTQYKNVTIGNIVMSTLTLLVVFILLGIYYSWRRTGSRLYIILRDKPSASSSTFTSPAIESKQSEFQFNPKYKSIRAVSLDAQ